MIADKEIRGLEKSIAKNAEKMVRQLMKKTGLTITELRKKYRLAYNYTLRKGFDSEGDKYVYDIEFLFIDKNKP